MNEKLGIAAIQLADELEVKYENNRGAEERTPGFYSLATKSVGAPFTEM